MWVNFSSSNVAAALYDTGDLFIKFVNGTMYKYYNVPFQVYFDLLQAGSKGVYHYHNIRTKFNYREII